MPLFLKFTLESGVMCTQKCRMQSRYVFTGAWVCIFLTGSKNNRFGRASMTPSQLTHSSTVFRTAFVGQRGFKRSGGHLHFFDAADLVQIVINVQKFPIMSFQRYK